MSADSVKNALLAAHKRLFQPLVRILLRHGVSYAELAEVVKTAYVEQALSDEQAIPGRKLSRARVAILTGLTRKEVTKVTQQIEQGAPAPSTRLNRVTRVLVGWWNDPDFQGPYGMPLELPVEGGTNSFTELCRRHSGDMPARALLDELVRVSAVQEVDNDVFRVLTRSYIPSALEPESLERLGKVVRSFIETIDYNFRAKDASEGRFERRVYPEGGLRKSDLEEFNALIRAEGKVFLEKLDTWLETRDKPDSSKEDVVQTGVGVYHYVEGPGK